MSSLAEMIRTDAPLEYGAAARYLNLPADRRRYRFTSRFDEEVKLYREDGDFIWLPRALCPVGGKDTRTKGLPVDYPKRPEPRPNQVKMFGEVEAVIREGLSGLVVAGTGFGKTVLGYDMAAEAACRTLVVCTKDDIYKKWIADAPRFLGISPGDVGQIRGPRCEVEGKKFVVAMLHSLAIPGKYPAYIRRAFGLVIFDEVQRLPAEHFQAVADMFDAFWRIGLSATPDRKDGKEVLIKAHIGPVRAEADVELLVPKVLRFRSAWQCPRVMRTDKNTGKQKLIKLPHAPGRTMQLEEHLLSDPVRNRMLADMCLSAYKAGRSNVLFTATLDHIRLLKQVCQEAGIPGRDIGHYGQVSSKAQEAEREKVKVKPLILTTPNMMAEGTDIPWLDTCTLAAQRSDVRQMVGRIRREYEDKNQPAVMDLTDGDSPVFQGYGVSRLDWYKSIGCEIVEMS